MKCNTTGLILPLICMQNAAPPVHRLLSAPLNNPVINYGHYRYRLESKLETL